MESKKITSILCSLLVFISGFITICPASHNYYSEVHFIADSCKSHDCTRSTQQSCNIEKQTHEDCEHALCDDKPFTDDYITVQKAHCSFTPAVISFIQNYTSFVIRHRPLKTIEDVHPQNVLRSTVLRI